MSMRGSPAAQVITTTPSCRETKQRSAPTLARVEADDVGLELFGQNNDSTETADGHYRCEVRFPRRSTG